MLRLWRILGHGELLRKRGSVWGGPCGIVHVIRGVIRRRVWYVTHVWRVLLRMRVRTGRGYRRGRHRWRLKVLLMVWVVMMGHMREGLIARTSCSVSVVSATSCIGHPRRSGLMRWRAVTVHVGHGVCVVRLSMVGCIRVLRAWWWWMIVRGAWM